MKIGLDIGSTTIKCVVLDNNDCIVYQSYERHYSHIVEKSAALVRKLRETLGDSHAVLGISGSAGMGFANACELPFVQEVFATRVAASRFSPDTDVIIELGGEDAKILFLTGGMDVRMNGSCAGGTGAFIDQMATLLKLSADEMNEAALHSEKRYTIASRCGVFAKTDVQPLLNQGAKKEDIAASIYAAVVNQTIAGLAQGRPIEGNVMYLGGPITFLSALKNSFDEALGLTGTLPQNSLYYVALGAALYSDKAFDLDDVAEKLEHYSAAADFVCNPPLFANDAEYESFRARHAKATVPTGTLADARGALDIGIDAGSTTVKLAALDEAGRLVYQSYQPNSGNPVPLVKAVLEDLYRQRPDLVVRSATATGYGEEIIKNAFSLDYGVVETVAHFTAAKHFLPEVDFVIDIGGQDMKCFKVDHGAISDIYLNEACSSGCGSFLQTFAEALGVSVPEFAKLGLFAKRPVDLGSRCTVFMNSSVKQAQKDGASIEDISAGLSLSVVKNALYKVIRTTSPEDLGRNIVVQGGTFYNEAVLRAFEQEMGVAVIRPAIAGLMGAYGAALYGGARAAQQGKNTRSSLLSAADLAAFTHEAKSFTCNGCGNHCQLTLNEFTGGRRFISGNRCEKPLKIGVSQEPLNMFAYKRSLLAAYQPVSGPRGKIGLPMGLNMYELLPFWYTFFTRLGFGVVTSPASNRALYLSGQGTIPSDTVCFPAKLMHGHIAALAARDDVPVIFYPCMSYNIDEGLGDNHYNCPVVAYYPEVIAANCRCIASKTFIGDYIGIHYPKVFPHKMTDVLTKYFTGISLAEVKTAAKAAYAEYDTYLARIRAKGTEMIDEARRRNMPILVVAGRPYHLDEETGHGIDQLICSHGAALISEDAVYDRAGKVEVNVLNQWTYHSRLYAAASYVATQPDMNLVQLVSFGCGVDAVTTDEVKEILHRGGKIYTQLKIDEITNLGAVNIRLRSLLAAIGR